MLIFTGATSCSPSCLYLLIEQSRIWSNETSHNIFELIHMYDYLACMSNLFVFRYVASRKSM